jgi:hypothetical protein
MNADITSEPSSKKRRVAGATQPRGKALTPVISEFGNVRTGTLKQCRDSKGKILRVVISPQSLNGDSRIGENSTLDHTVSAQPPKAETLSTLSDCTKVVSGEFRSPGDFLEQAIKAIHPLDIEGALPDEMVEALCFTLEGEPAAYVKSLLNQIRDITKTGIHGKTSVRQGQQSSYSHFDKDPTKFTAMPI